MKNRILILIALVLFVSAGMWSFVYSGGVSVNRTPSIVDDGTTVTISGTLASAIPTATANTGGQSYTIRAQEGAPCVSCSESSPSGGALQLIAGRGGDGDGSLESGGGGSITLQAGQSGTDGGAGRSTGGSISIQGGQSGTPSTRGNITIEAGTQIQFNTIGNPQWRITDAAFFPNSDSSHDIGTSTLRPLVIYADTFSTQNTPFTLGPAAATFVQSTGWHTITGDAGGNTVTTITAGVIGQSLRILFVDSDVTITDDNSHTANTIDLSAAFVSADDTVLQIFFDGTSWYEEFRSVN